MEKKVYEAPEVTKVEIDFSDRIVATGCLLVFGNEDPDCDFVAPSNS